VAVNADNVQVAVQFQQQTLVQAEVGELLHILTLLVAAAGVAATALIRDLVLTLDTLVALVVADQQHHITHQHLV